MSGTTSPAPGSRRRINMNIVKAYLRRQGAATYHGISHATGLALSTTTQAVYDLQRWDDEVLAVPAYGNSWRTSLGWTLEAKIGEASQLRHNGTRLTNQAHRLSKEAVGKDNPYEKALIEADVRIMLTAAATMESLALAMEVGK